MHYYKKYGKHFIENGPGKIRVLPSDEIQDPWHFDRVARIFVVQEILKTSPTNPIQVGHHITLSFPKAKRHTTDYTWGKELEPCQVYLTLETKGA